MRANERMSGEIKKGEYDFYSIRPHEIEADVLGVSNESEKQQASKQNQKKAHTDALLGLFLLHIFFL